MARLSRGSIFFSPVRKSSTSTFSSSSARIRSTSFFCSSVSSSSATSERSSVSL